MGVCRPTYPRSLLDAIKKGSRLQSELSQEILRVMQNDPEVKKLIEKKTHQEPPYMVDVISVLDDPQVRDIIVKKTWEKYYDLVKRSKSA